MLNAYVTLDPIETLYIASLLADQRRPIDRYIDYFGTWSLASGRDHELDRPARSH